MDNLFSFPSGARDAAAAMQASASDAPSNGLSNEPNAVGEAVGTASEDAAEVPPPRASEDIVAVHEQLHVRLKLLDERVFDVHVARDVSVADFRVKVEEATAIPVDLQRLIYRGKLLKDGASLSSYEIQDGHMIHLVSKPVAVAASSANASAAVDDAASEVERLDRFVGRSRERLRQSMRDEMRQPLELPVHTPVTRQSTHRDFELLRERARIVNRMQTEEDVAPATTRIRRPGNGDPTGDAWNLAVLREALGQQSDRVPRPSTGSTSVRESLSQGLEQQQMAENDAPAATVAAMGLTPSTSATAAAPGTTAVSEQPNLDHITQGILTLRTVLSTAALPPTIVEPEVVASTVVAATPTNDDPPDQELEELVPAAVPDFTSESASIGAETATENAEDGTSTAFTRLNEAIALIDQSIANANRVREQASEVARVTGTQGLDVVEESRPSQGSSATANTPAAPAPVSASIGAASPSVSPRRGRRRFFVGQWLDVKDTVNQWLECTVMDMSDEKVLVHYHGWPSRWDEWIDFDSDRIAAFRTRTQSTQFAPHLSPVPTTRLPNAPRTGENDMRAILPQLRDLMHHALPHIDRLAALCEGQNDAEDERRREELSEMAHLMAPFFDRFGRVLVDSARQLDPFIRPELRQEERRRRHQRARSGNSGTNRQTQTTEPPEDSAIGVRDLITPAARPPQQDTGSARRSIDVHIHAIVAPSSLSSLASLARLGTAIAGAMGGGGNSTTTPALQASSNPNELEDAFGLPRLRPVQEGSENRSILSDITEPDEQDAGGRYRDTSRTPLLSAFRRNPSSRDTTHRSTGGTQPRVRRPPSGSRLQDYLSDDFFGPSFSQDSDDMDDDDPLINGNSFNQQEEHDEVRYDEIPSPRESDSSSQDDSPSIGVIPEIEEAERRHQERLDAAHSDTDASRASSSSSTSSTGYPTFLEVMRRTLSGVRNFGFSSSSTQDETAELSATVPTEHGTHSDSEISGSFSSSSSSSAYTPSSPSSPSSPMTPPSSTFGTTPASVSPTHTTNSTESQPFQTSQPSYSFGTAASLGSTSAPQTTFSTASLPGSGFSSYRSWGSGFRPRQPSSVSDDDEDLDSVD